MSSSDSEDSFDYENYSLEWYEDLEGPPLIKKKSRLIAAVVQNQVEVLRDLLDSPRWYNVRDKYGYSLLQIAILRDNIEVFDYMLSIPDFPLEFVNRGGETALVVALDGFVSNDICVMEHFAYELIKKGACIDKVCFDGNAPLHCALDRSYPRAAKLLIQKGVDVNLPDCEGCSPLTSALYMFAGKEESTMTLLAYGAQPSVDDFRTSVFGDASFEVQEALFLHIYDKYSSEELYLDVLLKLAENKSALFYDIIEHPIRVKIQDDLYPYFRMLCSMDIDCLQLLIQNFGYYINKAFVGNGMNSFYMCGDDRGICLENLNVMMESELKSAMITYFSTTKSSELFQTLMRHGYDEKTVTELYCYLLSYGLHITELDLQIVYNNFGYCELFKILLHMDVQMGIVEPYTKSIMPVFMYDVGMDLDQFFKNHPKYCVNSINELLHYFAHSKLREICHHGDADEALGDNSQEIPLLLELARNVFREFFIKKFKIRTCRTYYTLLNRLPISNAHKKIISYETKLY